MNKRIRACTLSSLVLALCVIALIAGLVFALSHPSQTPAEKAAAAKVLADKNAAMEAYVQGMKEHAEQLSQTGRTYLVWSVEPAGNSNVVHLLDNNHHRGQLFVQPDTVPADMKNFQFVEGKTYKFTLRDSVAPLTLDSYRSHSVFDWLTVTEVIN